MLHDGELCRINLRKKGAPEGFTIQCGSISVYLRVTGSNACVFQALSGLFENGGIDEDINIIQGNIMAGRRRSDVWAVLLHQSV